MGDTTKIEMTQSQHKTSFPRTAMRVCSISPSPSPQPSPLINSLGVTPNIVSMMLAPNGGQSIQPENDVNNDGFDDFPTGTVLPLSPDVDIDDTESLYGGSDNKQTIGNTMGGDDGMVNNEEHYEYNQDNMTDEGSKNSDISDENVNGVVSVNMKTLQ